MTKNGMDSLTCDWVVRAESIYTGKITVAVEIIRDDDKSDKENCTTSLIRIAAA